MINSIACKYYPEIKCKTLREIDNVHWEISIKQIFLIPDPILTVHKNDVNQEYLKIQILEFDEKLKCVRVETPDGGKYVCRLFELKTNFYIDDIIDVTSH
jgi:hypothetical protein